MVQEMVFEMEWKRELNPSMVQAKWNPGRKDDRDGYIEKSGRVLKWVFVFGRCHGSSMAVFDDDDVIGHGSSPPLNQAETHRPTTDRRVGFRMRGWPDPSPYSLRITPAARGRDSAGFVI